MDVIQKELENLIQWFDEHEGYLHECELVTVAYELYMMKKEEKNGTNQH